MTELNREALTARATVLVGDLRARGVELVALTFVDNSGIALVSTLDKPIPCARPPSPS